MSTESGRDAVATYWQSVELAAASGDGQKQRRALELLRLRGLANAYRERWFPNLGELTIEAAPMSGRVSAKVDQIGGWGQGLSIKIKASRIDPYDYTYEGDGYLQETPGGITLSKDKSLILGHQLRECKGGEELRSFEAELIVLQQLLRAEQHRVAGLGLNDALGVQGAREDLRSYNGNGEWFVGRSNDVWQQWCADRGFPFIPCRHSRTAQEQQQGSAGGFEDNIEDIRWTFTRPSCAKWPHACMGFARDVDLNRECPQTVGNGESEMPVTPEIWSRWQQEQKRLGGALVKLIGKGAYLWGVDWPRGTQPLIDEEESGETIVSLPMIAAPIPTSRKVQLPFDDKAAAETLEHVLKTAEREHGYKGLWKDTLQRLANHRDSPGASRIQTELATEPTPIDAGPICSLVTGDNSDLIRACADLYLGPDDKIADLTWGKGVFWRKCPELNVTGSDLETVPERPYDFRNTPYEDGQFDVAVLDPPYIHSWSTHQTEQRYRGSTTHAKGMGEIWELYEQGMTEACRITRVGGRILVKTKDTVESGKQRWSHIHLAQVGERLGLYLRDLLILKTSPPTEKRWEGLEQKHSRKDVSYLLVFDRKAALPTPIEAEPEEERIRLLKSEPIAQDGCDFTLEQQVSHPAFGNGVIVRLFKTTGCAAIQMPDGKSCIVKLAELTPIDAEPAPAKPKRSSKLKVQSPVKFGPEGSEVTGAEYTELRDQANAGDADAAAKVTEIDEHMIAVGQHVSGKQPATETPEPGAPCPEEPAAETPKPGAPGLEEPSQSQLRKRPPTGQRNRLTRAETAELHDRLRQEMRQHQGNPRQLAESLTSELGLTVRQLVDHIRKVRNQEAA